MRRFIVVISFLVLILIAGCFLLNIEVTTRQGIDYKVTTLKIPLYLKTLDFYDRHYNYKWLVHEITEGKTGDEEKVMAIFNWSVENIKEQPKELPVVDDHVYHIIVRGYGVGDQFSDVFTTLCNYAGFDAFFYRLYNKEKTSLITFSLVKMGKKWYVFDPRARVYFTKADGSFASVEDIAKGNWEIKSLKENFNKSEIQYADYFDEILTIDFEGSQRWSRANIQSPIKRFFYGIIKRSF